MSLKDYDPVEDGLLVEVLHGHRGALEFVIPPNAANIAPNHNMWATKYKVRWAKVLKTGPGIKNPKTGKIRPVDVKPGDIVSFAGLTKFEDGDYVLICERDVLLVEDAN